MARLKHLDRIEQYKLEKNALDAYNAKSQAEKAVAWKASLNGKKTNRGTQIGYIQPFGAKSNFWFEAKVLALPTDAPTALEESETALINAVVGAVIGAATKPVITTRPIGATDVVKKAKKIHFAKVVVTVTKGTVKDATSRFTGRKYNLPETASVSCPFGAVTGGSDTEQAVQIGLLTAILVALPDAKVRFIPQGFVG